MTYERGQVMRVPFPFTDCAASKKRPALVLSDADAFNASVGHVALTMITWAENAFWPLDTRIQDLTVA